MGAIPLQPVPFIGALPQYANMQCKAEFVVKESNEDDRCSILTTDEHLDEEIEFLSPSTRQSSIWSSISDDDPEDKVVEVESSSECHTASEVSRPPLQCFLIGQVVGSSACQVASDGSVDGTRDTQKAQDLGLSKTKMCTFFLRGLCTKGSQCNFAHDASTMKVRPNLFRTSLCMAFERNGHCKMGDNCRYAHGVQQLKKSQAQNGNDVDTDDAPTPAKPTTSPDAATAAESSIQAEHVVASVKNTFLDFRMQATAARRLSV
jgi:hypothetical protein